MNWGALGRTAALAVSVPTMGVASPWGHDDSFLERVVIPDLWPVDTPLPMTRGEAMMVPAVSRSRHLIAATIARLPLLALRGGDPLDAAQQPTWCYSTDGQLGNLTEAEQVRYGVTGQSPFHRMLSTVDDLLFSRYSLWLVTRWLETKTKTGTRLLPNRMVRIPYGLWDVNSDNEFTDQDGHLFTAGDHPTGVVLIEGPHEGVLTFGARTIRAAGTLETTAADVAQRPLRFELHQTSDITLDPLERATIVAETRRALADNEGILFTNSALETKTHSADSSNELLIGGRNASAVDVARHMNIPAAMIDATAAGASLEYQTTETRNAQFLDYSLNSYMDAIAAALSMDAVVPAGQRIAFDTSTLTTTLAPTGPPTED